ncbi:hypothetical protein [Halalkalicoccus jeotgali]|uniref:Uncharacterized protein n=1 Tax=Halalkalicoccus jeotgali (strain DSM 18796 / CECT 7217 / JCM 14584 / KCTC 4019 / B3) TaxID=795797 RepID=D8JA30_HALJB|nr:hypothetical protein [Halalkalicoccus jeotgali]ADJ14552.1 hypothetical protein HacjB3_05805 [Halalkalicoccus jeotgali B3]ELY39924.1 hypothetical protein C497_04177 [Halalkalicoccus jeotgali B3]
MNKRSLVASLVFLALAFVGVVHTVADFAYGTGLSGIGIPVVAVALVGLLVVNR